MARWCSGLLLLLLAHTEASFLESRERGGNLVQRLRLQLRQPAGYPAGPAPQGSIVMSYGATGNPYQMPITIKDGQAVGYEPPPPEKKSPVESADSAASLDDEFASVKFDDALWSFAMQPAGSKSIKDVHPVQIFSNDKYVDRKFYLNVVNTISQPVLGETGLTTGKEFASMAMFDKTQLMNSFTFLIPYMEYDNILKVDPTVKDDIKEYVSSGHVLVTMLGDPFGMDYPVTMLNEVFNMTLQESEITGQIKKNEMHGFGYVFNDCDFKLPEMQSTFGVNVSTLPSGAYRVYVDDSGENAGIFIIPYGDGLIIGLGFNYDGDNVQGNKPWRTVLRRAVDAGLYLAKLRQGNSVIRHVGSTFGKVEPYGNWSADGKEELPPGGLKCVAWRKTLDCDPSGPRDPKNDKSCTAIVPEGESGYCECENYVQTAAAPCHHRVISCRTECGKAGQRYRDVYGDAYKEPGLKEMLHLVNQSTYEHYNNMMHQADNAVASVDEYVRAMKNVQDELNAKLNTFKNPPIWKQIDQAGKDAEAAGKRVSDMAHVADPFLPSSDWRYPEPVTPPPGKDSPQPPIKLGYPRRGMNPYQPSNNVFEDWMKDPVNAAKIGNDPKWPYTDNGGPPGDYTYYNSKPPADPAAAYR